MGASLGLIMWVVGLFLLAVGIIMYAVNRNKKPVAPKTPWYVTTMMILGAILTLAGLITYFIQRSRAKKALEQKAAAGAPYQAVTYPPVAGQPVPAQPVAAQPVPARPVSYAAPVPGFPQTVNPAMAPRPFQAYMPAAPTQLPQAYVPPGRV